MTVSNAVTLNSTVGNALGLTLNSGGKVNVTDGRWNVAGVVTFDGSWRVWFNNTSRGH